MSWGAVAVGVVGAVSSYSSGRSARRSAERAAGVSADAQREGLEYLKESERLPMFYRDQALGALASEYGLTPYTEGIDPETGREILRYEEREVLNPEYEDIRDRLAATQGKGRYALQAMLNNTPQYITEQMPVYGGVAGVDPQDGGDSSGGGIAELARRSPLYSALISGREAGEEALLRRAAATGGLRGGGSIESLADYNTQLENQALLSSYQNIMGGLSSLAGAQGYAPQIAQQYTNIGQTLGAGQAAGARAMQEGYAGAAQGLGQAFGAYMNRDTSKV